jgi:hypothetical protein
MHTTSVGVDTRVVRISTLEKERRRGGDWEGGRRGREPEFVSTSEVFSGHIVTTYLT